MSNLNLLLLAGGLTGALYYCKENSPTIPKSSIEPKGSMVVNALPEMNPVTMTAKRDPLRSQIHLDGAYMAIEAVREEDRLRALYNIHEGLHDTMDYNSSIALHQIRNDGPVLTANGSINRKPIYNITGL